MSTQRRKIHFTSGDTECAAWHYPGGNGACVIMAGAIAATKEPATDRFATRFHDAGFTVLTFDYRHLGESGGQPRQVVRIGEQLADWRAAIDCAAALPEVDPARLVIWGHSLSGGHVLHIAAHRPGLAAAIARSPHADGPAISRNAARHQRPAASLRFAGRAVLDCLGGMFGREPLLVPLVGEPGTVAALTTPDALDMPRALIAGDDRPAWQQTVAARSALRTGFYRPGRYAARIRCPLLVIACDQDRSALTEPALRAARHAPDAELVRLPGGHYATYLDQYEPALEAELSFLRRRVLHAAPELGPHSPYSNPDAARDRIGS
ncbi:alpha/beta hydrolase [Nocardia sp. CDC153]|uniref:alpha/beta hydrolase n=1 Tax=Nocardia sp. CDC153 TaxID=3112167 RepID=UPI002DB8CFDA|nr:alpha/beta hydrolase [Nocardia sp. CDC153]MEC3952411.1 alpha/beta hydrolase [Nocardia sp. CDC153]